MTQRDRQMHQGLMKILNDADFTIKRREAIPLLQVIEWAEKELPALISKEPVVKKTTRKKKA